ncbi:alpha/beta hydrolase family protein [Microbacterium mangrovi]|uniref:alpha/beta hydrolase family protein n=1 Tax=Microbacterium mangrovi TaxID=1348253 RepID=UPI0018CFB205|nr:alpha/beta fold hydrolase [Microbacterium mangrovi]
MKIGRVAALFAGAAAFAAAGIGWMIARRLTAPASGRVFDLTVLNVLRDEEQTAIVLDRTARTAAGGRYNLWLEGGGWVHLGDVIHESDSTVTRVVEGNAPLELMAGSMASWSGIYFEDPRDAGLNVSDVVIETPVGSAPAWLIEPSGGRGGWAVHIHGLGSSRAGTLRGVEVATTAGLVSLVVSYRNDGEGPADGTGRSTLGVAEGDDVRAAVRYAIAHGAHRIVLFGWSMGAVIALELATDPEFHDVIERVVLDSPVLDWRSTIDANCVRAGLPAWFGVLAHPWLEVRALSRLVGLQTAISLDNLDWLGRAARLRVPTLILHGVADTSTPYEVSRRVAASRPDVVCVEGFLAEHTMCWNSEPERWRRITLNWVAVGDETASRSDGLPISEM